MTGETLCTLAALTENDLWSLSGRVGSILHQGDILLLDGPLGAGKTSFARALIRQHFGDDALEVPSPTFSLAQCYEVEGNETEGHGGAAADRVPIWHFDLYRVEQGQELLELGVEDALDVGVSLIEWPDRLRDYPGGFPTDDALTIQFEIANNLMRNVTIIGNGDWRNRLAAVLGEDLSGRAQ